ncbi:MAG TPA: oligopeptide:H+ symporter [Lacunisphaera sp.]|nr:oligopeptide:H+ symporter [Lacunisphaera sp.]
MSLATVRAAPPIARTPRTPRQIPYIIGNEGCERFSFYGMRNILTVFLVSYLLLDRPEAARAGEAKDVFHSFVIGVYFFPLLGGWLADRFFGKYQTLIWFSLLYCVGHLCLALSESSRLGFYSGLGLIALGAGGIKPITPAFLGDQFDQSNKQRAKVVFDAFYWIINFGSFFASLLMPIFLGKLGPAIAFGIPGALMFVSTVILWAGRTHYVMVPPAPPEPDSFLNIAHSALLSSARGRAYAATAVAAALASLLLIPKLGVVIALCCALVSILLFGGLGMWDQLDRVRDQHADEAIEGARGVLRVLVLFAFVTPFWSLFDQKASTWVLQGNAMVPWRLFDLAALREGSPLLAALFGPFATIQPSQMQALNPALVMLLIPFNTLALFPLLRRIGVAVTPLRRMTAGIAFAGLAWIIIGFVQLVLDRGQALSLAWQVVPYIFLTMGEVLVSATGVEVAYSQAPAAMKGAMMSLWYLSVTIGNLWVLVANAAVRNAAVTDAIASTGFGVTAFQMFFFAAFALVAAAGFGWFAGRYTEKDYYRK